MNVVDMSLYQLIIASGLGYLIASLIKEIAVVILKLLFEEEK